MSEPMPGVRYRKMHLAVSTADKRALCGTPPRFDVSPVGREVCRRCSTIATRRYGSWRTRWVQTDTDGNVRWREQNMGIGSTNSVSIMFSQVTAKAIASDEAKR